MVCRTPSQAVAFPASPQERWPAASVVFRSGKNIYAQIIDDAAGRTLAIASTLEKAVRDAGKSGANVEAAGVIGKLIAERGVAAGVSTVVFDRGAYLYHGRVKALAEAAREADSRSRKGSHMAREPREAAAVVASGSVRATILLTSS